MNDHKGSKEKICHFSISTYLLTYLAMNSAERIMTRIKRQMNKDLDIS